MQKVDMYGNILNVKRAVIYMHEGFVYGLRERERSILVTQENSADAEG